MILSIVRGDFKSFLGKKTNTPETWKTYFKPNILEGKSKRFVLRKKKDKKKKEKERKNTRWKKKSGTRSICLISIISEEKEMLLH